MPSKLFIDFLFQKTLFLTAVDFCYEKLYRIIAYMAFYNNVQKCGNASSLLESIQILTLHFNSFMTEPTQQQQREQQQLEQQQQQREQQQQLDVIL
jgi:hypothetical protein